LDVVAERNPQVGKAVVKLRELSADERARDLYERREKARRDESMRFRWELKKQNVDTAKVLIASNIPVEVIMKATGLTHEEVEDLRNTIA
jgi:hypothetical protein